MAKSPAQNNLSKRILVRTALLDYCRMVNVSEADIDLLYSRIEQLKSQVFDDEKALDAVLKHDLEEIKNREGLKVRIQEMRGNLAERIFEHYGLGISDEDKTLIASIMWEAGMEKSDAKQLSQAICEKKLEEQVEGAGKKKPRRYKKNPQRYADKLSALLFQNRENMQSSLCKDFSTYRTMSSRDISLRNPVIEVLKTTIREHISGVESQLPMVYNVRKTEKAFRDKIRKNFSREGGSRQNFVKLIGIMAQQGAMLNKGQTFSNFDLFSREMKKIYGDNYLQEMDKALGLTSTSSMFPDEQNAERQKRYAAKSKELYLNMMASILTKKMLYDGQHNNFDTDYSGYVETIERTFIAGLMQGETKSRSLCFEEPDVSSEERTCLDDTAERDVVTVHHKRPVGAAFDIHDRLFRPTTSLEKERKSCEITNTIGNHALIIGKDVHDKFEANGKYILVAEPDAMIFAGEVSRDILGLKLPPRLKEGLARIANSDQLNIVKVSMNFSDCPEIEHLRGKLKEENVSENIVQKYQDYE